MIYKLKFSIWTSETHKEREKYALYKILHNMEVNPINNIVL
jgi:hypothetical protein